MDKVRNLIIWLVTPIFLLGMVGAVIGQIIYVDAGATGANNGSSWPDAYNYLQDALAAAVSGDEIWVTEGVYKPDQGVGITPGDWTATFQLKNGVVIYGGFAGVETSLDQCDWKANETILSGDIGTPGNNSDNSYHVVVGSGTDETAVLDGFTITAGQAWGGGYPFSTGGGMLNDSGSPTVANCIFTGNSAWHGGGGMYNRDSSATITNCIFTGNSAWHGGGGMSNENWVSYISRPTITNCTFSGNCAGRHGGAMENTICSIQVTNCTFTGNSAGEWGGVMFNQGSMGPRLTNCSFIGNSAVVRGGVMYNYPNCIPKVTNCILWDNTAPIGAQISYYLQPPIVKYTDVEGGWTGEGNINANPCFVQSGYWDADGVWVEGDYHLLPDSPCIDAGTNIVLDLPEYDADGNPRIVDGNYDGEPIIDMGAYEYQGIIEVEIDIKPGSYPNAVNLGSYGLIPVAILSSHYFDATTVDPDTVELAGAGVSVRGKGNKYMAHEEDVNGDGLVDLVVHVATENLDPYSFQDGYAILTGNLLEEFGGTPIEGSDEITIVPPEPEE